MEKSNLTKCKTCGKEIAKTAKVCPSCGAKVKAPVYKKWWFWLIMIIVIGSLGSSPENTTTNTNTLTNTSISDKIYSQINSYINEENYVIALEKCKELKKYSGDLAESTIIDIENKLPNVTAINLYKEYEENQVKADSLYKDKLIIVTGEVESIGTDILDTTYITFKYKDFTIDTIKCNFSDKNEIAKIAELNKGDSITIRGICNGATLTAPTLNNCVIK